MKAKLTLDNGKEIEIELTEEQEKAINDDGFPENGDVYWLIDGKGDTYSSHFVGCWEDYKRFEIGNYFKTEQEAEDMIRALKLIENVRKERKELNGDWKPDWSDEKQSKWDINYIETHDDFAGDNFMAFVSSLTQDSNILGWYKSKEIAYQIIDKYKAELTWFFEEFLPERN